MNLADLRKNYSAGSLSPKSVLKSPLAQFEAWFSEAQNSQLPEPNAMTLATADKTGKPSARTVLLKEATENGFVFFTNYDSAKSRELTENPQAALLFTWLELERQIRIEGRVEKISREASEAYFQSRPKASQIGAWASPQSQVIPNRAVLEEKMKSLSEQYENEGVLPLPPNWGGWRLLPDFFEFWQGRRSRLHDRVFYKMMDNAWEIGRLAP